MPKDKKEKKSKRDEEIRKANKEIEDLVESIKDQMGADVKVVKIKVPKPSPGQFLIELLFGLVINGLLIVGTSGYFNYLEYSTIWNLLLFVLYFTLVEKISSTIMIGCFPSFIIKTMGLGSFIPIGITLLVTLIFPIFVTIEDIGAAIIIFVIILVVRTFLKSFLLEKQFQKKMRGLKKW